MIPSLLAGLNVLLRRPFAWRRRMAEIPLVQVLVELSEISRRGTRLRLPPGWLVRMVRWRRSWTWAWRKNRCLLAGLLLVELLPRAGYTVTLHFGYLLDHGQLRGHCWLSSPDLDTLGPFQSSGGCQEILTRTFSPTGWAP